MTYFEIGIAAFAALGAPLLLHVARRFASPERSAPADLGSALDVA